MSEHQPIPVTSVAATMAGHHHQGDSFHCLRPVLAVWCASVPVLEELLADSEDDLEVDAQLDPASAGTRIVIRLRQGKTGASLTVPLGPVLALAAAAATDPTTGLVVMLSTASPEPTGLLDLEQMVGQFQIPTEMVFELAQESSVDEDVLAGWVEAATEAAAAAVEQPPLGEITAAYVAALVSGEDLDQVGHDMGQACEEADDELVGSVIATLHRSLDRGLGVLLNGAKSYEQISELSAQAELSFPGGAALVGLAAHRCLTPAAVKFARTVPAAEPGEGRLSTAWMRQRAGSGLASLQDAGRASAWMLEASGRTAGVLTCAAGVAETVAALLMLDTVPVRRAAQEVFNLTVTLQHTYGANLVALASLTAADPNLGPAPAAALRSLMALRAAQIAATSCVALWTEDGHGFDAADLAEIRLRLLRAADLAETVERMEIAAALRAIVAGQTGPAARLAGAEAVLFSATLNLAVAAGDGISAAKYGASQMEGSDPRWMLTAAARAVGAGNAKPALAVLSLAAPSLTANRIGRIAEHALMDLITESLDDAADRDSFDVKRTEMVFTAAETWALAHGAPAQQVVAAATGAMTEVMRRDGRFDAVARSVIAAGRVGPTWSELLVGGITAAQPMLEVIVELVTWATVQLSATVIQRLAQEGVDDEDMPAQVTAAVGTHLFADEVWSGMTGEDDDEDSSSVSDDDLRALLEGA